MSTEQTSEKPKDTTVSDQEQFAATWDTLANKFNHLEVERKHAFLTRVAEFVKERPTFTGGKDDKLRSEFINMSARWLYESYLQLPHEMLAMAVMRWTHQEYVSISVKGLLSLCSMGLPPAVAIDMLCKVSLAMAPKAHANCDKKFHEDEDDNPSREEVDEQCDCPLCQIKRKTGVDVVDILTRLDKDDVLIGRIRKASE